MNIKITHQRSMLLAITGTLAVISIAAAGFFGVALAANTNSIDLEKSSSQYLTISDTNQTGLDITGDISLEAWVRLEQLPSSAGHDMGIISRWQPSGNNRAYSLSMASNNALVFRFSSGGAGYLIDQTDTSVIGFFDANDVGEWVHVAITADVSNGSSGVEIYKNGVAQTVSEGISDATSIYNSGSPLDVGRYAVDNDRVFDGLIDDVRVWSDVRTAQEITNNYQKELTGTESNLVGYWRLDGDTTDETSNSNDLTTVNSPSFSSEVPFTTTVGLLVRKGSNENITSEATLQNDDDLTVPLNTSKAYAIDGTLFVRTNSADSGFKLGFSVPSGSTMDIGYIAASGGNVSATSEFLETSGEASSEILIPRNETAVVHIKGTVETSSTAGDFQLQWAQFNSTATSTTVLEGGYLRAEEI